MPYSMIPLEATGLTELQSLPPRFLANLPLPTELHLCLNSSGQRLTFQLGEGWTPQRASFTPQELEAIALGVEHGRTNARDVAGWLHQKSADSSFTVTNALALDGVPAPRHSHWSLGDVLRELDATVIEARVAVEEVHELPRAA